MTLEKNNQSTQGHQSEYPASASSHGTMNQNFGSTIGVNLPFMQQMMVSNPSLLSQHPGRQSDIMYQNSLLDVANMMHHPLQNMASLNIPTTGALATNNNHHSSSLTNLSIPTSAMSTVYNNMHVTNKNNYQNVEAPSTSTTLGGVVIPPVPPNASTAQQVQIAAAAAAAEAAPPKGFHGLSAVNHGAVIKMQNDGDLGETTSSKRAKRNVATSELTEEEKKQLNRDRNRHHARSTRLRKKAYVNKLKELVDGLHAERSEEARKRRVAVQHLAEVQTTRRKVLLNFLQYHSSFENDSRKWEMLLEDGFFIKQPLTPFRSFRVVEIEQSNDRDCRISKGVEAIINDAASLAVMIENVGCRSARWQYIKRDEFICREECKSGGKRISGGIGRENTRLQHAISSLSSSSGSSNSSSDEEKRKQKLSLLKTTVSQPSDQNQTKKVSSSSSGSGGSSSLSNQLQSNNNYYHDYHAKPLPDPRLDGGSTDSDTPTNSSDNAVVGKHLCTDSSSSGDDEKKEKTKSNKTRVIPPNVLNVEILSRSHQNTNANNQENNFPTTQIEKIENLKQGKPPVAVTDPSVSSNSDRGIEVLKPVPVRSSMSSLPPNIARSGGISHSIRPIERDMNARLSTAPAVALPPFAGIGKRSAPTAASSMIPSISISTMESTNLGREAKVPTKVTSFMQVKDPNEDNKGDIITRARNETIENGTSTSMPHVVIEPDNGTTSSEDSLSVSIQANYHVNEDDMLLTENVLMCPFIFRTQDAVLCGALAECIVPGMLRAEFSDRHKLLQLEMVYDAMGFMQQLERASGNEGRAHIVPNSLETSLQPNAEEARVITTAKPPYRIVSVNGLWTRITKYTQLEAEKKELTMLEGDRTKRDVQKRQGKPFYDFSVIAKGQPACCTNLYYDKFGREFIAFVSSYPVSNMDETTHILHIFKELKENDTATEIQFRQHKDVN